MATVTGLTATRMLAIEAESIVAARKVVDDLVLTTHGGVDINVGNIRGPQGLVGPVSTTPGPPGADSVVPGPPGPPGSSNASDLLSGTLADARLPVTSNAATVGGKLLATDPSVTNARTPTAHAASHATGGSDAVTLTKAQVGLSNVDNTADIAKPVSTTQQVALDAKAFIVEMVNAIAVSGAAQTIPAVSTATLNVITLSAACTLTFPVAVAGKSFTLILKAGGAFAVTWPASVKWPGGTAPALTTTVGKFDAFSFVCADGINWLGFVGGKSF